MSDSDEADAKDDGGSSQEADDVTFTTSETVERESPDDVPDYEGQWAANSAAKPDGDVEVLGESRDESDHAADSGKE